MIESRITFCLTEDGVPTWKLNELNGLLRLFRSVVIWFNLTKSAKVNADKTLSVLSLNNRKGDLCQLAIEGLDAELACMVLSEYVRRAFVLVATTHNQRQLSDFQLSQLPTMQSPLPLDWHYTPLSKQQSTSKHAVLDNLSQVINSQQSEQVFNKLAAREAISSTLIGSQFALPHIICDNVSTATFVFAPLMSSVQWNPQKADSDVDWVFAIILPSDIKREDFVYFARLTRWLLNSDNRHIIKSGNSLYYFKVIISHIMACYIP